MRVFLYFSAIIRDIQYQNLNKVMIKKIIAILKNIVKHQNVNKMNELDVGSVMFQNPEAVAESKKWENIFIAMSIGIIHSKEKKYLLFLNEHTVDEKSFFKQNMSRNK